MSQSTTDGSQPSSQEFKFEQVKTMDPVSTRSRAAFGNLTNGHQGASLSLKKGGKEEEKEGKRRNRAKAAGKREKEQISTEWSKMPIIQNPFKPKLDAARRRLQLVAVDLDTDRDPNEVPEYAFTSFEYFRAREQMQPIVPYMENQSEVNDKMRQVLVDWLVEMQESFQLTHETLYLSVAITDLYMSKKDVKREDMQLLGATAILLASKFYERYPPYLDDLVFVCDEAYSREQFLQQEIELVQVVDYDINLPVSYLFLRRFAKVVRFTMPQLTLARYVLELSLMEYQFVGFSASKLAASALLWSLLHFGENDWNTSLQFHTSYSREDLMASVRQLNEAVAKAPRRKLKTIFDKYSHENFFKVTEDLGLLSEDELNGHFERFEDEMEVSVSQ